MPKKVSLLTDWITIGTAGLTVDGREIPDKWLMEMAESYDPTETYTAVINADHIRYFGSFGQVREVRTSKNSKGEVILQARLEPNLRLMDMASYGQRLFLSMEVDDDFAGTGKAYLIGLALTDTPASRGTQELRFSKAAEHGQFRAEGVEVDANAFSIREQPEEETTSWLKDQLKSLFQAKTKTQPETESAMSEEQVTELLNGQKQLGEAVTKLTEALTKHNHGNEEPPADPPAPPAAEPNGEDTLLSQLKEGQDKLTEAVTKLASTVEDGIKNANPKQFTKGTGAADTEPEVL